MSRYLSLRDIDWPLLLIVLLVCGVGVFQIFSATIDTGFHSAWWRQILYVACGLLLMWLALAIDYHTILHYVPVMYIASVLALLGTALVGNTVFGSKRWVPIPGTGIHLQVSEFVKLVIILLAARYLTDLKSFMDPERDPQGSGYQLIQSEIAVGAGGMFGKGPTKGTQTQLRFLPVPHTDFIFSSFAEEHGFVGVVVVLSLYFVMIMRIVQNAQTAPDRAGMYICMGVGGLLLFHVLVNVGMVVGRMPVTGIPLPFMSAGGSSIWANFLALGLVNNVRLRRFIN